MNELKKILKPLKLKIMFELYIKRFFVTGCVFVILGIILEIISKFKSIDYKNNIYFVFIFMSFIVPIFIVVFKDKVDYFKTAKKCDSLGYNERFVTAYEILSKDNYSNNVEKLAVEDAFLKAKNKNMAKEYKITFPKRVIAVFMVVSVCALAVGFVKPYGKENFEPFIERNIENIKEIEKEAEKNKDISDKELKELKNQIKSLRSELKRSVTKEDAKKALEKTEQELKKLEKNSFDKDISKIADTLSKNQNTKKLSEALKNGNSQDMENALNELMENLDNLSDEEIKKMLSEMEKLMSELTSQDIKNVINSIADGISKGSISKEQIKNIVSSLSNSTKKSSALRKTIDNINKNISSAKSQLEGEGGSQGEGEDEGQGNSNGQGNGTGGNGNGQGSGRGSGAGNHAEIYTRDAINKSSTDEKVEGVENEGGNINITDENTIGNAGESMPYSEVYNEYRNEALNSMEKNNIPYGMRDMVTEYFSTLEE